MYIASQGTGKFPKFTSGTARHRYGLAVHTTGGTDSRRWLSGHDPTNEKGVSANVLIERDGAVHLLYPSSRITHHLGVGEWRVDDKVVVDLNARYIGAEVEQTHEPMQLATDAQYRALAAYHIAMCEYWGYPFDSVVGHYQVARPYGRRSDPVGFAWGRFWYHCCAPTFDIKLLAEDIHQWELTEN